MNVPRLSPRTGRPVRKYDDSTVTAVKALGFDAAALRKLITKWPEGAKCGGKLVPWHVFLAGVLVDVLVDSAAASLLPYTPPHLRTP